MGGGVMEVECYTDNRKEVTGINTEDMFGEDAERALQRISRYDKVIIYGNDAYVVINMNLVVYIEPGKNTVEFHFLNESRITIHKNGKIEYVSADYRAPYYTISGTINKEV